ncbi:hypothetical protein [Ktedonobacter robiniae]|uniref:hypothetical protein n=1 Tax=Ktedonobacter robiniae TaxID=2778365 RepID=UPI001F373FB1|nr:hypothetical protein [Ktedonobacter robiniae]
MRYCHQALAHVDEDQEIFRASGEPGQALDVLSTWEVHARFGWSARAIRACRAWLQLAQGDLAAVEQWAQEKGQTLDFQASEQEKACSLLHQQEEALVLARFSIAQRRGEAALREFDSLEREGSGAGAPAERSQNPDPGGTGSRCPSRTQDGQIRSHTNTQAGST